MLRGGHLLMTKNPYLDDDTQLEGQHSKKAYPYHRILLFFTGLGTILFGIFTFLHYHSKFNDSPILWLIFMILFGAIVLLFGIRLSFTPGKKVLICCVLAGLNAFYFFGFLLLDTSRERYVFWLTVLAGILMLVSLLLIFLIALTPSSNGKIVIGRQVIHVYNLLVGLVLFGWAILFGFGILIFAGYHPMLLMPLGFILFWSLSYWIQYKMISSRRTVALIFSVLTIALPLFVFYQYFI